MEIPKDLKTRRYYLPKAITDNYYVIMNGKNFENEKIRNLTTGQGEDYTNGCLLNYRYIKNHYRLIGVDLNRQKELNAVPKAIQQIEFFGQLKNSDNSTVDCMLLSCHVCVSE